jgi:acyl-CoA-binding protein
MNLNQAKFIENLDTNTKLQIYASGKQGRYGDCVDPEPFFLDIANHMKW